MRNIKYLVFTLFLFVFLCFDVSAATCDSNDIARLKEIAKNVTVTYEYDRESSDLGSFGLYLVTVSGLTEEIYGIVDLGSEQKGFFYTDDNSGVVEKHFTNGSNKLNIYSTDCQEVIRTIKVELPYYNDFSTYEQCDGISGDELYVCNEFLDKQISYSTFENEIKKYKNNLKEEVKKTNVYSKWFLVIGIVVVLVVLICIGVRKIKNNKLD